jgi:hypothetical protein
MDFLFIRLKIETALILIRGSVGHFEGKSRKEERNKENVALLYSVDGFLKIRRYT